MRVVGPDRSGNHSAAAGMKGRDPTRPRSASTATPSAGPPIRLPPRTSPPWCSWRRGAAVTTRQDHRHPRPDARRRAHRAAPNVPHRRSGRRCRPDTVRRAAGTGRRRVLAGTRAVTVEDMNGAAGMPTGDGATVYGVAPGGVGERGLVALSVSRVGPLDRGDGTAEGTGTPPFEIGRRAAPASTTTARCRSATAPATGSSSSPKPDGGSVGEAVWLEAARSCAIGVGAVRHLRDPLPKLGSGRAAPGWRAVSARCR